MTCAQKDVQNQSVLSVFLCYCRLIICLQVDIKFDILFTL